MNVEEKMIRKKIIRILNHALEKNDKKYPALFVCIYCGMPFLELRLVLWVFAEPILITLISSYIA